MYFPDLSTECQVASGPAVRAIGWLARGQPYPTAAPDPRFVAALRAHVDDPGRWLSAISPGVHWCDLGGCERTGGTSYVVIPAASCVYVAPELVVHYVAHHHYAPPPDFLDAVLACPEQCSDAYVALLVPFADTWRLQPATVRQIAARAPELRRLAAETAAREAANRGGFKW